MKKVKDLVESVKMWVKFDKEQAIVAGVLVGSLTIFGLGWFVGDYGTVSNTTHKELQEKYNELENDFNSLQHSKNNYEKLANNATSYNKLNSTEKELVDSYIKEVMEKSEEEKEIESFRNTYKPMYEVVDSGKSYYDMSDTEKAYIDSFLDYNFNDSPQKLQEEYQEKFDFYSTNREESKQRVIDEENARKAAEEEAKRQEEEEQRKQLEYGNAIDCAQDYVDLMAFSRQRLISQLEYEGYSNEAAVYAVDNIRVDWNSECAECAQDYLNFMSFSRQGLYDQLAYEGFTDEQIQYGLSQVGY